jgi:hypothetical protein
MNAVSNNLLIWYILNVEHLERLSQFHDLRTRKRDERLNEITATDSSTN